MRILITESTDFSKSAITSLRVKGHTVTLANLNYDTLKNEIYSFEGIIIRLGITIDKSIIDASPNLKFIATTTTGLDHIDIDYAVKRKVKIISLKDKRAFLKNITPTAELTMALIFCLLRNLIPASQSVLAGNWDRNQFIGYDLKDKTVGIIGLGRIGSMVAKYCVIFGAKIVFFDPYVNFSKYNKQSSLVSLAQKSDIISIHVPLNDQTHHLINHQFFQACSNHAVIINTSRGAVINENDLLGALKNNNIAAAALDVLNDEIKGIRNNNSLVNYARNNNNLLITPHIGGASFESMRKVEFYICQLLLNHLPPN